MQYPMEYRNPRLAGLDTLRAIAISIVLMENYKLVSNENIFGFMSELGWAGVDLFFVLSGYLIGNQILSAFVNEQNFSLTFFYIRRLLRTLPNYYLVLTIYFLFPTVSSSTDITSIWTYLIFTQNMNMNVHSAFIHSWSLCIEEQFYLIFPVITLLIACHKKSIALGWLTIIGAMLLGIFMRSFNWYEHGQENISGELFMEHIYYSSFTRFDEFIPGVAIAMFKNFHPDVFAKVQKKGNFLLVIGLLSVGIMFYIFHNFMQIKGYGFSSLVTIFGYSLLACSFGILVLAAPSPNSLLHRMRIPGTANLALWSYATYLVHPLLFHAMKKLSIQYGIDINTVLSASIIMAASIFCGWALYLTVERPFIKFRARHYPANHKTFTARLQNQQSG